MFLYWKSLPVCIFVIAFGIPVHAQIMRPLNTRALPKTHLTEDEACLPWALEEIRGATVSVVRLQVPHEARSEFEKACEDFHKRKLGDAERHVRNAIEAYSKYVAAWAMLGAVLEAREQGEKAQEACEQANITDPTYLPPYICLAEIDARSGKWDELLKLTKAALLQNPAGDTYAYFYRSMAYFNLNRLAEAETAALQAEGISTERREVGIHYLLAQIYEAKGDLPAAIAEIRKFLKLNRDKERVAAAKVYFAKLQAQQSGN